MTGDRVARARKWHEWVVRHGEEGAHYAIRASPEWEMTYERYGPLNMSDEARVDLALDLMIAADKESGLAAEGTTTESQPATKKPRHRPPDQIPKETVKKLKWELAQRKAKPGDPELTQDKIAVRLGLKHTRVQQAQALDSVGWQLLRSHPDFLADEGFVRWPNPKKAAQILTSERAEN